MALEVEAVDPSYGHRCWLCTCCGKRGRKADVLDGNDELSLSERIRRTLIFDDPVHPSARMQRTGPTVLAGRLVGARSG